jgi:hypothetical protein
MCFIYSYSFLFHIGTEAMRRLQRCHMVLAELPASRRGTSGRLCAHSTWWVHFDDTALTPTTTFLTLNDINVITER